MPKSYYQLGVWGTKTFRNFSRFITDYWYANTDNVRDELSSFLEKYADNYINHDFEGWETITYKVNGDIPFRRICWYICHLKGIKYRLARYQMAEICKIYDVQTDD